MNLDNKKGFTLVELLAVLGILGIVMSIGVASYINIRKDALQKDYENLISYIETRASNYANDTGITTISVGDLIEAGYLQADDQTDIYDPRDSKSSLNCYLINSVYEDGEYISTFSKTDVGINKENGKCNSYESEADYTICMLEEDSCENISNNKWFSENITLGVKNSEGHVLTESDGYSFNWSSNTGVSGKNSFYKTDVEELSNALYKVKLSNDNHLGEAEAIIKIDKQRPKITDVDYSKGWTNEDKLLTIDLTDFSGSGVAGVYVGPIINCSKELEYDDNLIDNKYETRKGIGEYSICVKDKVGNVGSFDKGYVKIDKIDLNKPIIKVKEKKLTYPVTTSYKLIDNIEVTDEGGSGIKSIESYIDDENIEDIKKLEPGTYKVIYKVVDNAGNETINDEVTLEIFVPELYLEYTGYEEEYIIPVSGKYEINLSGAQGANNGGKGAYLSVTANLNEGDKLLIAVGGQNGYNGGGIGISGTYNGGGATTVKLNNSYLVRAAGGGGGSNGTAGGSGNGSGGSSAGAGSGVNGQNSGGGSSSPDYNYKCNCSTCGGGCKAYKTTTTCASTCGGGCKRYYIPYCIKYKDENTCMEYSYCDGMCRPCEEYYDTYPCDCTDTKTCSEYYSTYECNCKTCTTDGNSGNGGSNYLSSLVTKINQTNGNKSGNGKVQIKYIIQ